MSVQLVHYEPPRSYARASRVGDIIFLAGEVGRDDHGTLVGGGIEQQADKAFQNIRTSLELFGLDFEDLVRMDVYLLEPEDAHPFLDVMRRYLPAGSHRARWSASRPSRMRACSSRSSVSPPRAPDVTFQARPAVWPGVRSRNTDGGG